MTDHRTASPFRSFGDSRLRVRDTGLVIEGEAVVLARRALPRPMRPVVPEEQASAGETFPAAHLHRRRRAAPDLIFQGDVPAGWALQAGEGRASLLRQAAGRRRVVAAAGALLAALLLPAAVLGGPDASGDAGRLGEAADFVVSEVDARILPRGQGAVLSVDALVRNVSAAAAPLPPVRLALVGNDGATWARPLASDRLTLAAGAALRFHSALAVPAGTDGAVSVDLVPISGER